MLRIWGGWEEKLNNEYRLILIEIVMEQGEIVIYKATDNADFQIEVRVENETVWFNDSGRVVSGWGTS